MTDVSQDFLNWNATMLNQQQADIEALVAENNLYRQRWGCLTCGEDHPRGGMCPPHEVRTTGNEWFRQRLAKHLAEIERLKAVARLATDYIRAARTNSGNEPSLSVYHRAEDALGEALAALDAPSEGDG